MAEEKNRELNQATCPLCGFDQRHRDLKVECDQCHAKSYGWFNWYLLKNEIRTIRICNFIIIFALVLFVASHIWMNFRVRELEQIISASTIQTLTGFIR
ncbi:MAG: hypothetical protein PHS75_07495 [Anaerolineaceae bacterium]|nr:hypothetical protein [Anaerolineaceae bacterium]